MKLLKFSIIILAIFLVMSLFGTLFVASLIFFTNALDRTFLEICLEIFLSIAIPEFIFAIIFISAICIGGLIYKVLP